MAFLGSIGKFLGNVAKPLVKAVPATVTGFATGGKVGAAQGFLSSVGTSGSAPPSLVPGSGIFSSSQLIPASFTRTGTQMPASFPQQQQPVALPVASSSVALTQNIFNLIVALAQRLNIAIRNPNSVVRIGRSIIARLIRFARANPGMTIINMLVTLGLSVQQANELIAWYSTHGKRRRRIKVTNVKALNRSVRRLEGFRRLSRRVEGALANRSISGSRTTRRRCPKCRKAPCCC